MKITKNNQNGRSMVEMLGVLAIIGVLSIGGIAGYSKAMFKYKMNKTLDVLSHAIARIVELDSMKWREDDTIETPQDMIKYGIVSDCEETTFNEIPSCKLPNGDIWLMNANGGYLYMMELVFQNNPFDSCVAFLNSKIYNQVPEDWWQTPLGTTPAGMILVSESVSEFLVMRNGYRETYGAKQELTATDVLDACDRHCRGSFCGITWYMKMH